MALLLVACGRIGYDGFASASASDGSIGDPDVRVIDGAAGSPGSDVSTEPGVDVAIVVGDGPLTEDREDGAADAGSCGGGSFSLLHWNIAPDATVKAMDMEFKVTNRTGQTIPLSSLVLRYYFTDEPTGSRLQTYYTEACCSAMRTGFDSNVVLALVSIAPAANPRATSYIQMGFDNAAGMLPNGDTVKLEVGVVGGSTSENQTNDYSYLASAIGTQGQWDQCPHAPGAPGCVKYASCVTTVHHDGVLVWGNPP